MAGTGKPLVAYLEGLSEEERQEHIRRRIAATKAHFAKRREEKALLVQQAKEAFAKLFIPDIEPPPIQAIEFVIEGLHKRVPLKEIRAAFPNIGEKAWKNLTSSTHKHMVSDPEQASLVLQKEADAHERILRKRENLIKRQMKVFEEKNKPVPFELLEMLFKAQDKKMSVRSQALLRSHQVGGLGGKKGKVNNNFSFKFNTPRPQPKVVNEVVEVAAVVNAVVNKVVKDD